MAGTTPRGPTSGPEPASPAGSEPVSGGAGVVLAELDAEQRRAWQAVRLRLSTTAPALTAAVYRAVPVAVTTTTTTTTTTGEDAAGTGLLAADADRWGRLYVNFALEQSRGIEALTEAVSAALRTWLAHEATAAPWHADLSDPRFPPVGTVEAGRLARDVARRLLTVPDPNPYRRRDDETSRWRQFAHRLAGPPQVSWQAQLSGVLRSAVAVAGAKNDYSYRRPSRHARPGFALPGLAGHQVRVTVVADVSPSIVPDLPTVTAEVDRIARTAGVAPDALRLLAVDHEVVADVPWTARAGALAAREDGRTDLRVGLTAAVTARVRPDVIVVLTDALTPWPDVTPGVAVIVAAIGTPAVLARSVPAVPAWARCVQIVTVDRAGDTGT